MKDITLEARTITAFGIKYLDDHWWHESLAERVGDTVYVLHDGPFSSVAPEPALRVFGPGVDHLCDATLLRNPRRLLESFEEPPFPRYPSSEAFDES